MMKINTIMSTTTVSSYLFPFVILFSTSLCSASLPPVELAQESIVEEVLQAKERNVDESFGSFGVVINFIYNESDSTGIGQ